MFRLFISLIFCLYTFLPSFADEINLTPQKTFSGLKNIARPTYPQLNRPQYSFEQTERDNIMKAKSVHEMGDITPGKDMPMTYGQFPQNYDSSNMMLMQGIQNGMQNMYMGY